MNKITAQLNLQMEVFLRST